MTRTDRPLDNPINWSFRAGRMFTIDIRVHVTFVIGAIVLLWMELPPPGVTDPRPFLRILADALGTYALLFFIVLAHEFGHCFGARYVGGDADEILLWPLGGLAFANPTPTPAAHMITTVAGPMVNVLFCAISSAVLVLWTGTPNVIPWNPLHPFTPVGYMDVLTDVQLWIVRCFGISYSLLWLNLLPIYPLDGGRILHAWLWTRRGFHSALETSTGVGMIGAILLAMFGLFAHQGWLLMTIAVFGYLNCWQTRRQLREFGAADGAYSDFGGVDLVMLSTHERRRAERKQGYLERRRAARAAAKAQLEEKRRLEHEAAVEAILRKVSQHGLASLTVRERRTLEEETRRKREETTQRGRPEAPLPHRGMK